MASWTTERARTAAFTRAGNQEAADAARRRLKALKAEEYVRRLVDSAPPLSPAQLDRLAVLLAPAREQAVIGRAREGDLSGTR